MTNEEIDDLFNKLDYVNKMDAYLKETYGEPFVYGLAGVNIYLSDYYQRIAVVDYNFVFNDYEYFNISSAYLSINNRIDKFSYDYSNNISVLKMPFFTGECYRKYVIHDVSLFINFKGVNVQNLEITLLKDGNYYVDDKKVRTLIEQAEKVVDTIRKINQPIGEDAIEEFECDYNPLDSTGFYFEDVPKVKKYLPKPAKDVYKRPVAKTTSTQKTEYDKNIFFVEVKFASSGKIYDYICDFYDIKLGDYVMVPTGNTQEEGIVVGVKYRSFREMPLASSKYKKVISKSTEPHMEKAQAVNSYYVLVEFEDGGKEYTYKCDLPDIHIGDFVRVKAQGKKKTVRVTDVVDSWDSNIRSKVLRLATDDEIWEWKYGKDEEYDYKEYLEDGLESEPEADYQSNVHTSYEAEDYYQPKRKERRLPSPEEFLANPRLVIEWETHLPDNAEDWWKATTDPRYWMLEYNEWSNEKAAEREREEEAEKQAEEDSWRRYYDDEE